MPDRTWQPEGWSRKQFDDGTKSRTYYVVSAAKPDAPIVLLLHEFPGISPNLRELAEALSPHYRVIVPSIFGRDGDPGVLGSALQICIRREIWLFAQDKTSPAVTWLRGLAREVTEETDERPYGVVGMCMTGGFALALAVQPHVRAAVVAQPALPISVPHKYLPLPGARKRAKSLGLTTDDQNTVCERVAAGELRVRGYRFLEDWQSPDARMVSLENLFGTGASTIRATEPCAKAHSTVTGDCRSPEAYQDLFAFLHERLVEHPGAATQ